MFSATLQWLKNNTLGYFVQFLFCQIHWSSSFPPKVSSHFYPLRSPMALASIAARPALPHHNILAVEHHPLSRDLPLLAVLPFCPQDTCSWNTVPINSHPDLTWTAWTHYSNERQMSRTSVDKWKCTVHNPKAVPGPNGHTLNHGAVGDFSYQRGSGSDFPSDSGGLQTYWYNTTWLST